MTVLQSRHNREFCERQAIARQGLYSCLESYILSVQITEKMFSVFLEIVSRWKFFCLNIPLFLKCWIEFSCNNPLQGGPWGACMDTCIFW